MNEPAPQPFPKAPERPARNPLVQPAPGDKIRTGVGICEIAKVDGDVFFWGRDRGRRVPMAYCILEKWPMLAKKNRFSVVA